MRQLIRRLSCVGDCTSLSPARRRDGSGRKQACAAGRRTLEGHVPVYVGDREGGEEVERFVVRAELLGTPVLAELLGRAAQEYRYHHQEPLRIPCPIDVFCCALASVAGNE